MVQQEITTKLQIIKLTPYLNPEADEQQIFTAIRNTFP